MFFSSCPSFNPETNIPDLSSKTIIVTGGNVGLGKETVLQLAKHHPQRLYLAARSKSKGDAAIDEILSKVPQANVTFLELDLSSFSSVTRAAETVLHENDRLDILINNAGIGSIPPGLTTDGYEIQFGTNHMGHALLTKLLMPLLSSTAAQPDSDVRIINLTSVAHVMAPKGGLLPSACTTEMRHLDTFKRYAHSKLANILFTKELARRYPAIKSVAIHPGRVKTTFTDTWTSSGQWSLILLALYISDPFIAVDVKQGALNQLWAATALDVQSGSYYSPVGKAGGESGYAKDEALAKTLWEWQEAEFAKHGIK